MAMVRQRPSWGSQQSCVRPQTRWTMGWCLSWGTHRDGLQAALHAAWHSQGKHHKLAGRNPTASTKYLQLNVSSFLMPLPLARSGLGEEWLPSWHYEI